MLKLWRWYQNCLAVHPVKTQVISSAVIWGFGDIAAQTITHSTAKKKHRQLKGFSLPWSCFYFWPFIMYTLFLSYNNSRRFDAVSENNFLTIIFEHEEKELKINWRRVAKTSLFGFGFMGPVGHFWYEGLDRYMRTRLQLQPNSLRFVAAKVAIDGIIFGPLDLLVFFTYMGFSAGKSAPQIKEDVKRDFLPALIVEGGIWPILQVANFRFVPVRYQLLYVNFFCLLDSCFLSWLEQQQDAPWKQCLKSFLQMKEQKG